MARTVWCDSEDDNEAVMLVTNLADGTVGAMCGTCVVTWAQALIEALASAPDEEPAAAAESNGTDAGEGGAAQAPPRPKRRRAGAEAAQADAPQAAPAAPDEPGELS